MPRILFNLAGLVQLGNVLEITTGHMQSVVFFVVATTVGSTRAPTCGAGDHTFVLRKVCIMNLWADERHVRGFTT
jgi:hypothetical protein